MGSRKLRVGLVAAGALVLVVVGYFAIARPVQVLPRIQTSIPFEMIDQNGVLYRYPDEDIPINVFVLAASWDEDALVQAEQLLGVLRREIETQQWEPYVETVFITPDPLHDDITTLQAALRSMPSLADLGSAWLTGAPAAMRMAVGAGLGIYVSPPEEGKPASYVPTLALVDNVGYVRGRYDLENLRSDRLLRDVGFLVAEARAEGSEKFLYKAAHLLLCYPR